MKIIIESSAYDMSHDKRFLIPYMEHHGNEIHFGFVNKSGEVIIPATYDKLFDDFENENDLVRVGMRFTINFGTLERPKIYTYFSCGVINSKGKVIIPYDKYQNLIFTERKTLLIAEGSRLVKSGSTLIDLNGNELIPLGKYIHIYNVVNGFARMATLDGFGVTDINGNEIIKAGVFDEIWDFKEHYDSIVVKKNNIRYTIPYETLKRLRAEYIHSGKILTSYEDIIQYEKYVQNPDYSQLINKTL